MHMHIFVAVAEEPGWRQAKSVEFAHLSFLPDRRCQMKTLAVLSTYESKRRERERGKKRRKKAQQAGALKMSYYVWSLNPLSPANTFLWLVSKSDKACVCSQLIDRTVLIKQYPSLGKESPQSHFTFSGLYCTKLFFLDELIFLKLKFEFSESAALISLLNNYLLTG